VKSSALRMALAVMGVGNADGISATTVGTTLVLGLLARERGLGAQQLRTSMVCSTSHALSEVSIEYEGQADPPVADSMLHGYHALYRLYEAAEGWVFLAAPSLHEWAPLCAALKSYRDLAADARFATAADRRSNDEVLVAELTSVFGSREAAAWEADLLAFDVACIEVAPGPVEANYMDEGSVGDQCGLLTHTTHPMLEEHVRLAPLVRMSRSTGVAGPGCTVGQHTESVLHELGYSDDRLAELRAAAVISA
jgi:crotonobetainyl-CoA:carnitine CoA-transferase CaiB-like acyl-CoA transferase